MNDPITIRDDSGDEWTPDIPIEALPEGGHYNADGLICTDPDCPGTAPTVGHPSGMNRAQRREAYKRHRRGQRAY